MLKGQYLDFKTEDGAGHRILIADTEQAPYNVEQNTRRIHIAAGLNPHRNNPDLLVLQLRPYDKAERLRIMCEEVRRFNPDFVLLDGVVDVCQDFNDAKESGKTIIPTTKQDREKAELYDLMRQVFENGEPLRHTDIQEAIRSILAKTDPKTKERKPCSENTAKSRISKAVELKVIRKEESGLYNLWEDPSFVGIPTDELQGENDII